MSHPIAGDKVRHAKRGKGTVVRWRQARQPIYLIQWADGRESWVALSEIEGGGQ